MDADATVALIAVLIVVIAVLLVVYPVGSLLTILAPIIGAVILVSGTLAAISGSEAVKNVVTSRANDILNSVSAPDFHAQLGFMSQIKDEIDIISAMMRLGEYYDKYNRKYKTKFVIFLDDLDRCKHKHHAHTHTHTHTRSQLNCLTSIVTHAVCTHIYIFSRSLSPLLGTCYLMHVIEDSRTRENLLLKALHSKPEQEHDAAQTSSSSSSSMSSIHPLAYTLTEQQKLEYGIIPAHWTLAQLYTHLKPQIYSSSNSNNNNNNDNNNSNNNNNTDNN